MTAGVIAAARLYADEVLADAPQVFLQLDESSGTTASDTSGNSRNGTYEGTYTLAATSLIRDGGAALDVNNGGVVVADGAYLDVTSVTVGAWVVADTLTGTDNLRIIASRYSTGTPISYHWHMSALGSKAFFRAWAGGAARDAMGATTLTTGVVYHVAATWDGSTARVYLNGALDGSSATSAQTLNTGDIPVRIGRLSNAGAGISTYAWDGRVDGFALYGSALSVERIRAHYAAGL